MKNYKLLFLLSLFTSFLPVIFSSTPASASAKSGNNVEGEAADCGLCYELVPEGAVIGIGIVGIVEAVLEMNRFPMPMECCGQLCHEPCLAKWLATGKTTCPFCRHNFVATETSPAALAPTPLRGVGSVTVCRTREFYQLSPSSPALGYRWVYTPVLGQGVPPVEPEEDDDFVMPSTFGREDSEFRE